MKDTESIDSYWQAIYKQFHKSYLSKIAFYVVLAFCIVGIYAPFLASSKPLIIEYDGKWYFPFFRYLFFAGFYTKKLDLFFNILMFTLPVVLIVAKWVRGQLRPLLLICLVVLQVTLFIYFAFVDISDPASDAQLTKIRQAAVQKILEGRKNDAIFPIKAMQDWQFDLRYMDDYAKLNILLRYEQGKKHHEALLPYAENFIKQGGGTLPTRWRMEEERVSNQITSLEKNLANKQLAYYQSFNTLELYLQACRTLEALSLRNGCLLISQAPSQEQAELKKAKKEIAEYWTLQEKLNYFKQRKKWIEQEVPKLGFKVMPLLRPFHWEEDAGGNRSLNQFLPWWELTRIGRKDLLAALIFGIRISLVVGFLAVSLAMIIGVPVGAFAGFYGGKFDIVVSRLLEIWESMPTFFMLLLVIAITQSKSIFLVIGVIGLFGWTSFSRFTRGEFFKQRNLAYVEASRCLGFGNLALMFKEILPNAIPPLLTLLPFAIMSAITSEAGLSFLGLGEEGSSSWGILMDEGRTAFPAEAYLLWPPAILLTILLVAIALVGDGLRDALDPKLKK